MLRRVKETSEWDIIIIGGGATGLGAAVDAASRGYKTLLLEKFDFAKGTSSRSTKLVHGGVRYLAQGNIKLVMEALRERGYLLKNAPHLTSAKAFVVPVYSWFDKFFYGIGLKIYDVLSGKLSLGKTQWLNKSKTLQQLQGINAQKVKGGILYYDGQFDDARLAVELAATAVFHGAAVINYAEVTGILKEENKIAGIQFTDTISQTTFTAKTNVIINATGVFTNDILQMDEPGEENIVAPSQGIHLVVDKKFFPSPNAMMIPKTSDGRVLFAVPWHDKVVIGTTDTALEKISFEPEPLQQEIEFVLHHANLYLQENITRADVTSMFAGLRPLVKKKGAKKTSVLSRDHIIMVSKSNLVTITGGKWTTYRKMAEDAIDNAVFVAKLPKKECVTKFLAIGNHKNAYVQNSGDAFIHHSFKCTAKDIEWFIKNEMAQTVEDILARRTRLLFLDAKAAIDTALPVAKIMAAILNKNNDWINNQVETFSKTAAQYCLQ